MIVHVFTNLDEFIEYGRARGSIVRGIAEYCGPYLLSVFDRIAGILGMMAAMFVIAWLYRTNELTAILAAGISKGRVIRPILFATAALLVVSILNRELLVPRFADSLGKSPKDLAGEREMPIHPMYDQDRYCSFGGRHILLVSQEIGEPIFRLQGPSSAVSKRISGKVAKFQKATADRPQGFLVEEVRIPSDIAQRDSVYVDQVPFILCPKDTPWLKPDQCFVTSTISFELLEGGNNWKQYSSTLDLIQRLRADPRYYSDDVRATVHARLMRPLMDLGLILFGLPIVLGRQERHLFWVAGTSIGLMAGYLAVMMGAQAIGSTGTILSPSLAAILPILLLFPIAWVRSKFAMES